MRLGPPAHPGSENAKKTLCGSAYRPCHAAQAGHAFAEDGDADILRDDEEREPPVPPGRGCFPRQRDHGRVGHPFSKYS